MRKTVFTIIGALAIISSSFAGTYKVKSGDTFIEIAHRLGIDSNVLKAANPKIDTHKLKIGQILNVPSKTSSKSTSKSTSKSAPAKNVSYSDGSYTVVKNDNDWIIARKLGITVSQLHSANPKVDWRKLQIGQKINKPGTAKAQTASAPVKSRYAQITKDSVIVRTGASTSRPKITTVSAGTKATILDHLNGWYKLKFPHGTVGWVRGDMMKSISATQVASSTKKMLSKPRVVAQSSGKAGGAYASASPLIKTATSMLGTRYRYGAMSRSATDCSGFTTQVFAKHGIKIPRTSREQSKIGTAVSKSALKAGDLVFFHTGRSSRINHVGIYMGGGKFIHSSSGKGSVRIDSINDGYYSRKYVTARRVSGASKITTKAVEEITTSDKDMEPTQPADAPATEPAIKNPTAPTGGVDDIGK
ncbi:MAG: C40 family peptidase [Fimbriimonadaceae bacterium]|nr:C40 family peptidase [Fimbriimonadaceae bacterium]